MPIDVTQLTLCKMLQKTDQTLRAWEHLGMPGVSHPTKRQTLYDLELCIPWILTKLVDPGDHKSRLVRVQADRAEMALKREQGLLVAADDVVAARSKEISAVRDRLLAAPQLIRGKLPVAPSPQQIEDAAKSEIFASLSILGGDVELPPPPKSATPKRGRQPKGKK